ncbi:odorant receptor Or1 [Plutella xylostella]|uniref:odorant receptor Or1 n=1 Tax=Plutella xylostella TaxID=51655 RepID=UPI0020322EAF|nr:odorant receptor Or1 [Plutella xylostella]
MGIFVDNRNRSIRISLTALKFAGFWAPDDLDPKLKTFYHIYSAISFMFLLGTYLIIQVVDMCLIWGDLQLMTGTAFVLFTNLAQAAKLVNLVLRRRRLLAMLADADAVLRGAAGEARRIVERCDRGTSQQQLLYFCLTTVTVAGWAGSAEKNQLPLRAWYPYDTSKSPAYELTYCHQVGALFIAAYLNVAKDTLVSTLIAQTRCRLQLLTLALSKLHDGMASGSATLLSPAEESLAASRLRACVGAHQAALRAAAELQACFSAPTAAQFAVSMVIICVTAFQLAAVTQTKNYVRLISMGTYLMNMAFQVFIYCYQGNELREEASVMDN